MKIVISVIFAIILLTNYGFATPADTPKKDTCQKLCAADYNPICAKPADGKGTEITFGNNCVLENYNCQKKDKPYVKSASGECSGKAPVRLS